MPLPTVLFLAFATGIAAALAGRTELKISPRPALLTRSSLAFLIFDFLVLVPASAYFYAFHGDWFLLYVLDVQRIPSAVALVGFVLEGLLAAGGFALGAGLVRTQRETIAGVTIGLSLLFGIGAALAASDRLAVVGSYAQYRGSFGLVPFTEGPLFLGTIAMCSIVAIGLAFLLARVWLGARRQG
ncbi:hypothetical protein [Sandaracinus amylolyticus]|uniref:Uncharacterized protein n=1 Tax=Sandaracinus amylolyticus TaxID=927083 RepID=A0A0F6W1R9_9BACT|nr:hypothetical protein [Sandaracinus amylolyticus]AKF05287.1 hypothetical protein DB32_002436 [Sandaracinus amylolyticus]